MGSCISSLLTTAGLLLDIVGAYVLTVSLIVGKSEALELGLSRFAGETDEQNLQQPAIRDRLRQARNARIGLFLLVAGFVLQIFGTWWR